MKNRKTYILQRYVDLGIESNQRYNMFIGIMSEFLDREKAQEIYDIIKNFIETTTWNSGMFYYLLNRIQTMAELGKTYTQIMQWCELLPDILYYESILEEFSQRIYIEDVK